MEGTVNLTRMDEGTYEEYQFLEGKFKVCYDELPDNVLGALKKLQGDKLGYHVDRCEHSLQTATRAFRDGADEETVVVALLHDIGDLLAPENHGDLAAAVLKPYVSEANHWLVRHHPVVPGLLLLSSRRPRPLRLREVPQATRTSSARTCSCDKRDQMSFDPNYDTMPLDGVRADGAPALHQEAVRLRRPSRKARQRFASQLSHHLPDGRRHARARAAILARPHALFRCQPLHLVEHSLDHPDVPRHRLLRRWPAGAPD